MFVWESSGLQTKSLVDFMIFCKGTDLSRQFQESHVTHWIPTVDYVLVSIDSIILSYSIFLFLPVAHCIP